eukprot:Anaeramoba_ignava/a348443_52.p2 GENE.a348443_52~~a348443_52.p2  ORF type:complete len:163 (+),score=78.34 a348443_52:16-504(+)
MSLIEAVKDGNFEEVKKLINGGADVNEKDESEMTSLHHAATNPDLIDILDFLLEKGADPNANDQDENTPLHKAAFKGNLEGILSLQRYKAESQPNRYNKKPDYLASRFGNEKCLEALLNPGKIQSERNPTQKQESKKIEEKKEIQENESNQVENESNQSNLQ